MKDNKSLKLKPLEISRIKTLIHKELPRLHNDCSHLIRNKISEINQKEIDDLTTEEIDSAASTLKKTVDLWAEDIKEYMGLVDKILNLNAEYDRLNRFLNTSVYLEGDVAKVDVDLPAPPPTTDPLDRATIKYAK